MRFILAMVLAVGTAGFAGADTTTTDVTQGLTARTPDAVMGKMQSDPRGFLADMASIVLGYGGKSGIDAAGIDDAIAAQRAQVRAREMRRLLTADLNDDLAVDPHELQVLIHAASATMRGRLLVWHGDADYNDDGTVSWDELRNFAQMRGQAALDADAAADLRALMVFDLNGNGLLTVDELRRSVDLLGPPA